MSYYPLLKHSNAEIGALSSLKEETKALIIPIIESKMIPKDSQENWEATFRTIGTYLKRKLSSTKFIYDFHPAFDKIGEIKELRDSEGKNLVNYCVNKLEDNNLQFIPCVHFDSPEWLINAVSDLETEELAIRIRCHDFNSSLEEIILGRIEDKILSRARNKQVTLILDFYNTSINKDRIENSVRTFSNLAVDNTVLLQTNCPENADGAPPNSFTRIIPRNDLKTYQKIQKNYPFLHFGDYTVRLKPELDTSDINYYNTYLKIFYSSEDDYFIGKSMLLENGPESFTDVCQQIVDSEVYKTPDFSTGDKAINDCAQRELKITNHSKPIEFGINHHIELTALQLEVSPPVFTDLQ